MNRKLNRLLLLSGIALFFALGKAFAAEAPPQNEAEDETLDVVKISEAFGHFIGRNLKSPGVEFDLDAIIKGIRDGADGKAAPMSDQDYEQAMIKLQERTYAAMSRENLAAANAFLEDNRNSEGVIVLEEGKLQYIILAEGEGEEVKEHSAPMIHYTGKYLDGTLFGNSKEVGNPITIPLDQTIPGFSKGLLGMKTGEKRRLFVHPDLGYGTLGNLPPNALLIFDIEVVQADSAPESGDENRSL